MMNEQTQTAFKAGLLPLHFRSDSYKRVSYKTGQNYQPSIDVQPVLKRVTVMEDTGLSSRKIHEKGLCE